MNYNITTGSFEDLERIAEINEAVFGGTKSPDEIRRKLSLYQDSHITLGKADETVGYGMGYEEKDRYYFWMLGVLPEYRGKGIGSGILDEQIDFARRKDYPKFLVKTSNRWRNMLSLTIKRGFNITGFKANEWGSEPAIWLELDL